MVRNPQMAASTTESLVVIVCPVLALIGLFIEFQTPNTSGLGTPMKRERIEQMYAEYEQEFPGVPSITPEQLRQELASESQLILVDVRQPAEQQVSMIPGAITQQEFETRFADGADATVVTYCTIGYRSGKFAAELRAKGVNAVNLRGSLLGWCHSAGELVNENGPTHRAHVYSRRWNLLPDEFEAVW